MFRYLYQIDGEDEIATTTNEQAINFTALFASGSPLAEIGDSITQALMRKISKMLSIYISNFCIRRSSLIPMFMCPCRKYRALAAAHSFVYP